ncbi:hypothetical protein QVD17_29254 [Tagetes erecta]|uniref:Uncharacterized protein n=1 Tax=Tagetes erecta TaxID=13708 RepID=A0AAD8KBW3_TARER|nr:hypothetical protein QVD17_29254 [Tagetes erecta]
MGKHIVRQESKFPAKRTRVWLSNDSYKILKKGIGSETIEGLALDMKMLQEESSTSRSSELKTNALQNMDSLKLLQLNFVELDGPYDSFSEDLRWLCWFGFPLETIPPELYMGHLVAIDMSYSKLITFEPPAVLESLKVLNLKDSHSLVEIGNIFMIPCLETLVLWNCYNLTKVCDTIEDLKRLALLNMTGCNQPFIFRFPSSLRQLFLKDCNLEEDFRKTRIRFLNLEYLQYLSLVNNPLISYDVFIRFMMNLRVLDMSFCSRVKYLYMLPSTLKELYIYYCESLEIVSFSSQRFTLQEIGYEGCISLREIEGFIKLVPIAQLFYKIGSTHFAWIYKYRKHKVCLVGDDELTVGRSWQLQMLYEFDIMSTSLPDIKDPNMTPKYISKSSSLSFEVPLCPENKRLEGINVSFKYALSGDVWVWFCKISTKNGLDLMYNPKVFGKPEVGEVCIWLSYWPIGNKLSTGDTVHVSIVEISGLKVHECGVSLVYSDKKSFRYIRDCKSLLERESSNFQLSTGAYYFCRRDFFELTEVGRLTPDWFRILVGDTIDDTEVRGWRKTGRPQHMNPSSIELKMVKCILDGPQLEDIYNTAEMSKSSSSSSGYKPLAEMISGTKSDPYSNIVSEALAKPLEADLKLSIKSGKEDELEYEYGKEDEPPYESGDEDDDDDAY